MDTLYEVLEGMSMNKFNVMHWHIVDEQRFVRTRLRNADGVELSAKMILENIRIKVPSFDL